MIYIINKENRTANQSLIASAMRLRYRVFKQRMGWEVKTIGDQEKDEFDSLPDTIHILHVSANGEVDGCVRLLSTAGPNMLSDIFGTLLDGQKAPCSPQIWESTRFAVDQDNSSKPGIITARLLDAMVEVGVIYGLKNMVAVTDLIMERILKRNCLCMERIGQVHQMGKTKAVASNIEVDLDSLQQLRAYSGIKHSQIYMAPWIREAA